MAEEQDQTAGLDDLLKNAIPIDQASDDDVLEDVLDDDDDEPILEQRQVGRLEGKSARQEQWTRQLNPTGTGSTHVRTFVAKLTKEGIAYMDEQINTWLAENPEAVVKFATVAQGDIQGRTTDPSLLVSIWV
jgi:hypothetical protein